MARQRFQADSLSIDQIRANLLVLADFRTQEGSSNLTIREGRFIKTSGKLNIFKGVVRDAEDSLTNQVVLDEILKNLGHFANYYLNNKSDDNYDVLCNGMYGFLKLGGKYRGRDNVDNIANAMSTVCETSKNIFSDKLISFNKYKNASYNQGTYNRSNNVYLGGTCWAMVADWARRFVLKGKMGYAHGHNPLSAFPENKLLHRGKFIAHVFNLKQDIAYQNMGTAIGNIPANAHGKISPNELALTNDLLKQYRAEQKGSKKTIEQKFDKLSYAREGHLGLGNDLHIANSVRNRNTRLEIITNLTNKIKSWTTSDSNHFAAKKSFCVHGIGFWMEENIGFTGWRINRNRQQNANTNLAAINLFGIQANRASEIYRGGHEIAFAYNPSTKKCYFMDPNYGEWELPNDPHIVANLMYSLFKMYTVGKEKNCQNPRYFCKRIYGADSSLFSTTP